MHLRTVLVALPIVVLAAATAAGCAPPAPEATLGDSFDAFSTGGDPSVGAKITRAWVSYNPAINQIIEGATIPVRGQTVRVCHAYEDGTEAQRRACDDYPNGYRDMTCIDTVEGDNSTFRGNVFSDCQGSGRLGSAPYDQGDGRYTVHFVNASDPSDRRDAGVVLRSDFFLLKIDGKDYPPYANTFLRGGYYGVPEGSTTRTTGSLRLTVEVLREAAPEVKGCAGGFSTAGLSTEEIAAKDAELVASCASPDAPIEGREGWRRTDGIPVFDRSELTFDATPFVARDQHLVFAFASNGRVRTYIFEN